MIETHISEKFCKDLKNNEKKVFCKKLENCLENAKKSNVCNLQNQDLILPFGDFMELQQSLPTLKFVF